MHALSRSRILRTFSANDWNHPESKHPLSLTLDQQTETAPSFSSNAEKLRKFESQGIEEN
jgi:hypothetical protein